MSIHLYGITSNGGLPIFNRSFDSRGKPERISFTNVSVLNAVHLYCDLHQTKLQSATTENNKICWKGIDSITLIIVINRLSLFNDEILEKLLTLIYNLILMFCTKDELNNDHLEKIKIKIKTCYFVIDYIIECFVNKINFIIQTNCLEFELINAKCSQQSEDLINDLSIEGINKKIDFSKRYKSTFVLKHFNFSCPKS